MRFVKKPVEIEAIQFTEDTAMDIVQWLTDNGQPGNWETAGGVLSRIEIETLEGVFLASPGDWVIRGIKGEFYPCKPDIFEASYDEVKS